MTMKNGFVKELESKMLNAVGNFAKATSFVTGRSYNRTPGYPNTNHGTLMLNLPMGFPPRFLVFLAIPLRCLDPNS